MSPEEWLAQQQASAPVSMPVSVQPLSPEEWLAAQSSEESPEEIIQRIPTGVSGIYPPFEPETAPKPEPGLGERALAVGETALATATGATGGTIGMLGGILKGLAEAIRSGEIGTTEAADRVEQLALESATVLTYEPRTELGKEYTKELGETLAPAQALTGLTPVIPSAATALPVARAPISPTPPPGTVRRPIPPVSEVAPTPGTGRAAGAAPVDIGTVRQLQAEELPVPIKLTEGQKTRSFEQQRFERETAKLPEAGAPLRERFAEQNLQLQQNMDAFIDATGAQLGDVRGIGEIVDKTFKDIVKREKTKLRVLWKNAEKAGDTDAIVNVGDLAKYMNENRANRARDSILGSLQRQIDVMEVGNGSFTDGSLQLRPMSINEAEKLRVFINENTDWNTPQDVPVSAQLKSIIDTSTDNVGGSSYKKYRTERTRFANNFENISIVRQLLSTKRGTDDRAIALEDVLNKTILSPSTSLDAMRHVRRLLQTKGGEQGKQAWSELQGGTLRHIQEQMTKSVSRDERGNPIVSPAQLDRAITQLDKSGKLDYIFGKKGANQLRVINDVAKDVLTAPPGAVNTSNTATVLAGLMDVAISGTAGVPAPILSSFKLISSQVRDKKLKARVKEALGEK